MPTTGTPSQDAFDEANVRTNVEDLINWMHLSEGREEMRGAKKEIIFLLPNRFSTTLEQTMIDDLLSGANRLEDDRALHINGG